MERTLWYKDAVFYQIWPRSFKDGNGDGIGDLMGVYEKLDYIKTLHVDAIWFSPLYPSPNADYGYDVMDYMDISIEYGGMEAFKKVLDGAHERGIRVVMDLVVNHTSDEHPWFQASRRGEEPYKDYYIWRKGADEKTPPNNWDSLFEGRAWRYDEERGEHYLHLFAVKQPDLNMDNPRVREEVKKIMRFWLDLGVDGFREDVITFISKREGLPDGSKLLPAAKGMSHYSNGPHLHEYLSEFRDIWEQYDCVTIGEAPLVTPRKALEFIGGKRPELDLMISFECMEGDCFMQEYIPHRFSLVKLKLIWERWQKGLRDKGWNFLYLENHDHPRVISRYGSEKYRVESGKALAASYLFQQGTPMIYQGQEIGMTNIRLATIGEYEDIQTKNHYHRYFTREPEAKRMERIWRASRDSARTPMQWDGGEHAGFSAGEPWFVVNPNYTEVNVADQEGDPDSLLNFYREAVRLRKELPVVRYGSFRQYERLNGKLFVYERRSKAQRLLVICSYSEEAVRFRAPRGYDLKKGRLLLHSHGEEIDGSGFTLQPYETRVYLFQDRRPRAEI
ncbi:MAG: alpha-glucosidase [Oscillospiraceae bacterium]|nr:alpha-glucosidase [Oscillospiraceae bacterium]